MSASDEDIAADCATWDAWSNKGEVLVTDNYADDLAQMMAASKEVNPDDWEDVP